jgi:hypothetical protein
MAFVDKGLPVIGYLIFIRRADPHAHQDHTVGRSKAEVHAALK